MYTLYTLPGSCSTGIAVLMEKLGVEYTLINRNDEPNYKSIVPTNQVPALKTEDGTVICEGGAISLWLMENHGYSELPTDAEAKSEFYQWHFYNYATLHPAYSKMFATYFNSSLDSDTKQMLMDSFAASTSHYWKILDDRLTNQDYIMGATPCFMDYMIAIYSSWNNRFAGTTITLGDNVKRVIQNVMALPEFQNAYVKENVEFKQAA